MPSEFMYTIYIKAPIDRVWNALIDGDVTQKYWVGIRHIGDWTPGGDWKNQTPKGTITDSGKVIEFDPPKHLALSWRHLHFESMIEDADTICSYDLEQDGDLTKLTLHHRCELPNSRQIAGVSKGWPSVLSALKSYLETGETILSPVDF